MPANDPMHMRLIMSRLEVLWKMHPHLRLGQLIGNALRHEPSKLLFEFEEHIPLSDPIYRDAYYMPDLEFIQALENFYFDLKNDIADDPRK